MAFQLSILIPSIPEREDALGLLETAIDKQRNGLPVELLPNVSPRRTAGGPNIPTKRNQLYEMATGKYSVQIDDDDRISTDYVEHVLAACEKGMDCITYDVMCIESPEVTTRARISTEFDSWYHKGVHTHYGNGEVIDYGEYNYLQAPYYKVPILTSLCRRVKLNETLNWREDADFMRRIRPLLQSEVYIPKELYVYYFPVGQHDPLKRY